MRSLCHGQSLPSETTRLIAFGLPSQVHSYRINTPLFSLRGSLLYLCRYYYSRSTVLYKCSISRFPSIVKRGRQCAASNCGESPLTIRRSVGLQYAFPPLPAVTLRNCVFIALNSVTSSTITAKAPYTTRFSVGCGAVCACMVSRPAKLCAHTFNASLHCLPRPLPRLSPLPQTSLKHHIPHHKKSGFDFHTDARL